MQRMGMVIGLKPEDAAEYKRLHAETWPEILAKISEQGEESLTSRERRILRQASEQMKKRR